MQVGIFGVLGVVFIVLKIVGVVAWPWIWVLAPIWGPLAVAIVLLGFGALTTALLSGDKR